VGRGVLPSSVSAARCGTDARRTFTHRRPQSGSKGSSASTRSCPTDHATVITPRLLGTSVGATSLAAEARARAPGHVRPNHTTPGSLGISVRAILLTLRAPDAASLASAPEYGLPRFGTRVRCRRGDCTCSACNVSIELVFGLPLAFCMVGRSRCPSGRSVRRVVRGGLRRALVRATALWWKVSEESF